MSASSKLASAVQRVPTSGMVVSCLELMCRSPGLQSLDGSSLLAGLPTPGVRACESRSRPELAPPCGPIAPPGWQPAGLAAGPRGARFPGAQPGRADGGFGLQFFVRPLGIEAARKANRANAVVQRPRTFSQWPVNAASNYSTAVAHYAEVAEMNLG